jgi:hypothetical protein
MFENYIYIKVELFINYDCDLEAIDLFRRIIDAFAKTAKVNFMNLQVVPTLMLFLSTLPLIKLGLVLIS